MRPDLVVGDFRLSLPISAPLFGVRHAALINAYWSPFAVRGSFPVPDHPIIGVLGERLTARYFPQALPWVFDHFASPVNALRRRHGLPALGSLREVLTAGDDTLYADEPALVPIAGAPPTHRYLGPVLWAPSVPLPPALEEPDDRPLVYVTLGSSGRIDVLPSVIEGLRGVRARVVLATAGRVTPSVLPGNFEAHAFVPGDLLARRARVVISNGGSTTSYQALAEGTPVIGLPSNLDQYLAMTAIEDAGAGVLVKARQLSPALLAETVERVLTDGRFRTAAQAVAARFRELDSGRVFRGYIESVLRC